MRPEVSREIPLMVGQVMRRDFDFYPFIGFSNISEGSGALRGQYNGVIYHLSSSRGYSVGAGAFSEIFDGNECRSGYKKGEKPFVDVSGCIGKGGAWVKNEHGYFDGAGAPQIVAPFQFPISSKTLTDMAGHLREFSEKSVLLKNNYGFDWWLSADQQKENKLIDDIAKSMNKLADYFEKASAKWAPRKIASSHMVLGQLNGKTIPIIVRTGAVNPGSAANGYLDTEVDDESGIAILAPAEAIPASMLDGNYVGADSNFSYTATYFKGSAGIFSDPMTLQSRDRVTLDYDKQAHGLIDISLLDQSRKVSGHLISVGGIYAALMNGTVNGGMSDSASKIGTPPYVLPAESAPYFVVGAKVGQ
ncbi:DUF2957 domain-containing protein [Burkholderia sp. A1]|uniref:DUF2957 domain-containing protein n=1 Tax=Burkholderia sp. A1 TaxID=148446 RepID=UPI003221B6A5